MVPPIPDAMLEIQLQRMLFIDDDQ